MREHGMDKFFLRRFKVHGDDKSLDEFGNLASDKMSAQELPRPGIEDCLDQALIFPKCNGLAIPHEGKATYTDFPARRLSLGFCEADGCNLRMTIGAARDLVLVQGMHLEPLDPFRSEE